MSSGAKSEHLNQQLEQPTIAHTNLTGLKPNSSLVEISIDTSTSPSIDTPQLDSGSNQSGSDSGLGGCTNSISSDNSTFNITTKNQSVRNITNTTSRTSITKPDPSDAPPFKAKSEICSTIETNKVNINDKTKQIIIENKNYLSDDHNDGTNHLSSDSSNTKVDRITNNQTSSPTVTRSLLKKPPTSSNSGSKHKRSVSFNQTVIVFCEEADSPTSCDQYEPPLGYTDTFEPPEDYCDPKIVLQGDPLRANDDRSIVSSKILDSQLLGILDSESIHDIYRFDNDEFSEGGFPENHLNSNYSYLCNDALFGYDSDSESSICVGLEKSLLSNGKEPSKHLDSKISESNDTTSKIVEKPATSQTAHSKLIDTPNTQKSMPARVKVSTVDTSLLKKNPTRNDDIDFKTKSESAQVFSKNPSTNNSKSKIKQQQSSPLSIKQTNIEPLALSRTTIVTDNLTALNQSNSNKKSSNVNDHSTGSKDASSQADQINNQNQIDRGVSIDKHLPKQDQAFNNVAQRQQTSQNQSSCHMCRMLETSRMQSASEGWHPIAGNHLNSSNTNNFSLDLKQQQDGVLPKQQSVVTNPCSSCCEVRLQQATAQKVSLHQQAANLQNIRPVACQIVYVVDQNGNRVKALSVIRATPRLPASITAQGMNHQVRAAIQSNIRFPNPTSISQRQVFNPAMHQPQLINSNAPNGGLTQYRMIRIAGTLGHPQQKQQVVAINGPRASIVVATTNQQCLQRTSEPSLRQPTVYYIHQPLDFQNSAQLQGSTGSYSRSFPDPHEIRRLDGLKGPITTLNLSQRSSDCAEEQRDSSNIVESEDPSFGFSKRPAVKVVATSAIRDHNRSNFSQVPNQVFSCNSHTIQRDLGNHKLVPVILSGSQTLDRRQINQSRQCRETIPNTTSMSDIGNAMQSYDLNQQPRISAERYESASSNLKFKANQNDSNYICHDAPVVLSVSGRQASSLTKNDLSINQEQKKTQVKTEIAYSMNI